MPWLSTGLTIAETLQTITGPAPVLYSDIALGDDEDLAIRIYGRNYKGPKAGTAMFTRGIAGPPLGVSATVRSDGLHFDAGALQRAYGKPLPRVLAAAATVAGNGSGGAIALENRSSNVHRNLSTNASQARALVANLARFQPWQAHHLIPFAAIADLPRPAQLAIATSGWKMDSVENLVVLPADEATYGGVPNLRWRPYHRGGHPRYNSEVTDRLEHLGLGATRMSADAIRLELRVIEDIMFRRLIDKGAGYHPRVSLIEPSRTSTFA